MSRLLNIGCGSVFHRDWTNLDAEPAAPEVIRHDLRRGLPFAAGSFDAVYGSHVLEHLAPAAGARLLAECRRVLAPSGVLRVAVPDLEEIARQYLGSLEGALAGDAEAALRYEWAMLELYDQAVRTESGGAMGACLRRPMGERQKAFVASRIGDEVEPAPRAAAPRLGQRIALGARSARRALAAVLARILLGSDGPEALREGLFRRSGEVHQWMYDRYSLARALEVAGFIETRACVAEESRIPGFARYRLEARDGRERKPDSLYVEALRPREP